MKLTLLKLVLIRDGFSSTGLFRFHTRAQIVRSRHFVKRARGLKGISYLKVRICLQNFKILSLEEHVMDIFMPLMESSSTEHYVITLICANVTQYKSDDNR